jgi:L-iditol 2-dehydrogenase
MLMKAAVFHGIGNITIEDRNIPKINDNEILIRISTCAVCGTDLRIFTSGHFKIPEGTSRVLGHEIAGVICNVGVNVSDYKPGMRVAVPPNIGCGKCMLCLQGFNNLCADYDAFGITLDGGFQEYMKVPELAIKAGNVVPISDDITFEEASIVEPLSCCYHSLKALKTSPGDTVLIIGAGPIGALHVIMSKLAGARKIIVADLSQKRLDEIIGLGADVIVDSSRQDLNEIVMQESEGLGVNVVITACSAPEMQMQALLMACAHGRINFFGGLPIEKENVLLNTNIIHYKELTVLGTTGSSLLDYYKALQIISSKKIDVKPLISARFEITDIVKAFELGASGKGMKAIMVNREITNI